jgi:hypothetical protein
MPNPEALRLPEELLLAGAGVKSGFFTALRDGQKTLAAVAEEIGADCAALERFAEALAHLGYVEFSAGAVELTATARRMLFEPESADYIGYAFMHAYSRLTTWLSLPEVLKTGKALAKKERSPERLRYFMDAMREHARQVAPAVVELCLEGLSPPLRLLDLGGGPLNYAVPFARRGVSVTVQDIPEVVELMRPLVPSGLEIRMVAGDFNVSLAEGPYEVAFLGNITHIYGPEENQRLFARVARELTPGGRITILDYVRGLSARAPYMGVNMLVSSVSGGVWTVDEYAAWLASAGFGPVTVKSVADRQVLLAHLES